MRDGDGMPDAAADIMPPCVRVSARPRLFGRLSVVPISAPSATPPTAVVETMVENGPLEASLDKRLGELYATPALPRPIDRPSRAEIEAAVRTLIAATGDDPEREGLRETPARVAKAYKEWFSGYGTDPSKLLARMFSESEGYEETILLRDIPLVSTCEHHMAPIKGVAHVAYRPRDKVVGISKLSRLVDAYARRLQLQERLTNQIAQALDQALAPKGVAVIIEATHGCMTTRGVNQHGVSMVTKCWLGEFRSDGGLREELMRSIGAGPRA